jgi:hypothetical protein
MRNNRHPIQLHFQEDGTFLLRENESMPGMMFPSLLDALNFAHSLSPHSDTRLTVFDANGKEIIETFV